MRPGECELDEEIRGHIALSIQERIDRGEAPDAARAAAWREFGYLPDIRESMRRVWYTRGFDAAAALADDMRIGLRSLRRAKGFAATVIVTLALGIGANAATFSVVRGVLMRPLVNRGEDRVIYIRQSAPGLNVVNLTFSVPEIQDLRSRVTTLSDIGEFSTIDFTMVGIGEARLVKAGVVNGSYFEVLGLRPVLGRLITAADSGPAAAGVAVLTHRFWTSSLNSDPSVVGRMVQLGPRSATVIGVLEPSVPYPADTEIIANIVTSPHHLGAMMTTLRTHRMTELFGRLARDATLESARAELSAIHADITQLHPDSYPPKASVQLTAMPLRDQIVSPARTILLVLLAAVALVFLIACLNVAILTLARSVRREGELAVRAALGAGRGALRRTLLAESLVLCGAGAALGMLLARPLVGLVSRFAGRFSVRALEVTVDASLLWSGAALAMIAAVVLAYVPRLPSANAPAGLDLASGSIRVAPGTHRRLRIFAISQIACSFVLLAAAGTLLSALVSMQTASTGYNMRQVLAIDVPAPSLGLLTHEEMGFYHELMRRTRELPGVQGVAIGAFVPWRDAGALGSGVAFAVDGYTPENGEETPRARLRVVSPGFFSVVGVPLLAGRDFTPEDRHGSDPVVVISQSIAQRLFRNGDAMNRRMWWTDPYFGSEPFPRRIIGIVADVDDESVVPAHVPTVYHPTPQMGIAGRLFVHAAGDPYALVPAVRRMVRDMSPNQPVERPATLQDVRAEVLAPERLHAFVLTGFAGIALLIAVVGVAGVLAFSVSARTREFGVRLAVGSTPGRLLVGVLSEGAVIVAVGIAAGAIGGYAFSAAAERYLGTVRHPGFAPLLSAAAVLLAAALLASLMPAARAARLNVLQALRLQ